MYEPKQKLNRQNSEVKLSLEKMEPFVYGMIIFKKFGNSLSKVFDPSKSLEFPPESCGYAVRTVILNNGMLEFRKERKVELKIKASELKSVLISPQIKKLINQYKKNVSTRPNSNTLLSKQKRDESTQFVQFKLIIESESIDLIAHNYMAFISFNDSVEELVKYKDNKSLEEFLSLLSRN